MKDPNQNKRRLLTAGIGVAVYTAFEGLACGNPVEPRCLTPTTCVDARIPPADARADAAVEADAQVDAADIDAAVDASPDPAVTEEP